MKVTDDIMDRADRMKRQGLLIGEMAHIMGLTRRQMMVVMRCCRRRAGRNSDLQAARQECMVWGNDTWPSFRSYTRHRYIVDHVFGPEPCSESK